MSDETVCGRCRLPIHRDSPMQYFGTFVTHQPNECVRLLRAENERLRNFARQVMQAWPHGDVDGGELQEIATECGLLRRTEMHKPCGHYCACLDFGAFAGLQDGETVTCYRRTDLLREQQEGER